jgi:hypothetical protein
MLVESVGVVGSVFVLVSVFEVYCILIDELLNGAFVFVLLGMVGLMGMLGFLLGERESGVGIGVVAEGELVVLGEFAAGGVFGLEFETDVDVDVAAALGLAFLHSIQIGNYPVVIIAHTKCAYLDQCSQTQGDAGQR